MGDTQVKLMEDFLHGRLDRTEVKNVRFGVGRTQVQTLALPFTSRWVTLDKLFHIALSLSFLREAGLKLPPWSYGEQYTRRGP